MIIVAIAALVVMLLCFAYPLFMPNLRRGMTREEIARELENKRNLAAELNHWKGLEGEDQFLWRHAP